MSTPLSRRLLASAVSAALTAVIAHVVTLLVLFVGNGFDAGVLAAANGFFGFGTLISFLLLTLGGAFGGFARWWLTLIVGVVAAFVGATIGTTLVFVLAGNPFTATVFGGVIATFAGVNLIFFVALVVTYALLARRIYLSVLAGRRPAAGRRIALVRLPADNLSQGAVTHQERVLIDPALADSQWSDYVDALRAENWDVVEVPAAPDLADSVFVEDAVVMFGDLAVVTRPGSDHRLDEVDGVIQTVTQLGLPMARIEEPGTLDGGDVLKVGERVYVGRGGRTNAEGVRQLRAILASPKSGSTPWRVVAVPTSKVLHLKSAVTALPDGTILGHPDAVDDPRMFSPYLEVPEPEGAHVVILDDDVVLMSASAPRSIALIESLGYRVVVVELSEFEKLEGCVTCLSVRVR
ncbi:dimethylarginine dimethylaminohydrolase [Naasia lichenicola]|uniref:Dimethylarginine dimethylaminohydrolase n=1 Tax=Naasia lichenicola TaxID=2565933 RepID=A0A4S4FJE5_9MICO|nr:dimethylarginine dimethylaminohydrolase [Naasia lichenicola]